jgi:hypothetical protein
MELKMVWKEAIMVSFKVACWCLPQATEENHENFGQDSSCHNQDLNEAPPDTSEKHYCLSQLAQYVSS